MPKAKTLLVVAVLAVGALGGAGYWLIFRDTAPPRAALPSRVASGGSGTVEGTWRVQTSTDVFAGYRMHELFGGDALSRTVVGRTPVVSGTAVISGTRVTSATVVADLTQLKSDEGRRDRYIRTHALDTTSIPSATFHLRRPIELGAPILGQVVSVEADGQLTLHGVTRVVTVQLQARWNGTTIDVTGSLPIVLAAYGIQPPDIAGLVKVDGNGQFELQLTFARP